MGTALAQPAAGTAAVSTVTVVDDGSNMGTPGTFYWAITNTAPNGLINFAIPGAGPHYLQIPPGGFPIIYRQGGLTIDGYTQPGSAVNTNSLSQSNSAIIKIVVDGRTGNATDMRYNLFGTSVITVPPINNTFMAAERPGLTGIGESGLLGIYRSTNVTIKGISFLGKILTSGVRQKGIVIEMDYDGDTAVHSALGYPSGSSDGCHINGCWFGVNPTNVSVAESATQAYRVSVTSYRHTDAVTNAIQRPVLVNGSLTLGVKAGSLNPRAEFNVMAGVGGWLSTDSWGLRCSGNYISVLPDGTPFNFISQSANASQYRGGWFDVGCRFPDPAQRQMVIGTDGDGVNDADEGNVFGPLARPAAVQLQLWGFFNTDRNPFIIAGNRIGIGNDGTVWTNNDCYLSGFRMDQGTQVRFGSDFNGVSDALEANIIYDNNDFATQYPTPSVSVAPSLVKVMDNIAASDAWFSFRGNKQVNNFPIYNPDNTTASQYTNTWNTYFPDVDNKVPVLSASTITTLNGTFNAPNNNSTNAVLNATNCIVDVYVPDPEGQVNGAAFAYTFFGATAWPAPGGWGFVQGKTYLGSFLDNGPYDSNPAVGAFSFNIAGLGIGHGTNVTVAVTYSKWKLPNITSIVPGVGNVTLTWTGDNGGPYNVAGAGGPTSGFGVQSSVNSGATWTTTYAANNSITLPTSGSMTWYRIVAPISGFTTLCAPPVTLP